MIDALQFLATDAGEAPTFPAEPPAETWQVVFRGGRAEDHE